MTIIYYSEINLICIILLFIFKRQMRYNGGQLSADSRIFGMILWTTGIMCASDMVAGICRGQLFGGARALIEISNLIYYEAISVICFLWMAYVFTKLKIIENKKELFPWSIPLIAISIVTLINPFTHWLFKVDENNLYARNAGISFHWIVTWSYLIVTTAIIAYRIIREKEKRKRQEAFPLLSFIVAPAIAAFIQMLFYGVTCYQVGITVSIIIIFLTEQNNRILTDALTGLNNRYGFNKYWENYMQRHSETKLSLMMIDIDSFKQVNDKFGHLEGDRALADVADAVKQICEDAAFQILSCRYGGDEILIAGCDCRQDEFSEIKTQIHKQIEEKNNANNYPYVLSVSIGTASGACRNADDIDKLLRMADEAMYAEKKRSKSKMAETLSKG